ncbi:hypothetical protein VNO77_02252 [Canavalia gladiata]|uniref:Uncharacterized protein n=1 Tax=Canavalia gladiata TaxID=3824 RepID=A0AAN9MSX1_CANGL
MRHSSVHSLFCLPVVYAEKRRERERRERKEKGRDDGDTGWLRGTRKSRTLNEGISLWNRQAATLIGKLGKAVSLLQLETLVLYMPCFHILLGLVDMVFMATINNTPSYPHPFSLFQSPSTLKFVITTTPQC